MFSALPFNLPAKNVFTSSWTPASLSSTNLRFWTRPESLKWQNAARTTPANTAGQSVYVSDDESGNALHAVQGAQPTYKTNGGLYYNSQYMITPALGAWTGDFAVAIVAKTITHVATAGVLSVDFATAFNIMLDATSWLIASGIGSASPPYGQITSSFSLGTIHSLIETRVGTALETSIDGLAPGTATVSSASLPNTSLFIGSNQYTNYIGDIHEIIVIASPSGGDITNLKAYLATRMSSGVYV